MKNKILLPFFSILLTIVLLTPSVIQLGHALEENHTHDFCSANNEKHFHIQKGDCQIFHKNIHQNAIAFFADSSLQTTRYFLDNFIFSNFVKYLVFFNTNSSRAPPSFDNYTKK